MSDKRKVVNKSINSLRIRRHVEGVTPNHTNYIKTIRQSDLTICEGVAGTGKTYMAVGVALNLREAAVVKRLVIVRPVVPAGEHLGFLPGDLVAKIDPYMRPITDAIWHFCQDAAEFRKLTDQQAREPIIEICPLAVMRGRTFDDAFVLLDEAQNCTVAQMEMFFTRMGKGSKVVITGDLTQSDLYPEATNGLDAAIQRFQHYPFQQGAVNVCFLTTADIMRHGLIAELLQAYHQSPACLNGHIDCLRRGELH